MRFLRLKLYAKRDEGTAAIEFAFIAGAFCFAFLNCVDLAIYFYDKMQVQSASEMGAHAAWTNCDLNHVPATTKCSNLTTLVTAAVQSTSLGNNVTLATGSPAEGYYCINASNALEYVAAVASPPSDCSAVSMASLSPGDYITVQARFTYTPLFTGITVSSLLPTTISSTAWMRLG